MVSSQTMALWFWKRSLARQHNACQISIERIEMKFTFYFLPLHSFPHPCCFCDARNDVCFRLRAFKWVDVFELEADSQWAWGLCSSERNMMRSTYSSLPFSPCCLSVLSGGCWLSLPCLTSSHRQAAHLPSFLGLYCLRSMQIIPVLMWRTGLSSFIQCFELDFIHSSSEQSDLFSCVVMQAVG